MPNTAICPVCPHHCKIAEGSFGRCNARKNLDGKVVAANYGKLTAIALDSIEKKPLAFYKPGSMVVSVGSYGCNLACPFCQNHDIAYAKEEDIFDLYELSPNELLEIAKREQMHGNIGVAYTYNEALVGYEYVLDCAKLVKDANMDNVLVSNGMVELDILKQILPYIDAMNIDLKGFRSEIYEKLGGSLKTVMDFIKEAYKSCHMEITSLIVPGLNDSLEDMANEAKWIASLDLNIPLHITRYFPRYKMSENATDISLLYELRDIAGNYLNRVCVGNV
ncbi:MAG: AmmeMemoRadiSam system radical SAM enzyme [Lachnospiraceae bacterium]|nr:AmmeMemoRadiSam system radical SAM enzyme [Lachnospiraceae bacterium]